MIENGFKMGETKNNIEDYSYFGVYNRCTCDTYVQFASIKLIENQPDQIPYMWR